LDTARQQSELLFVPCRGEVLEEASAGKGFLGLLGYKLASADFALFDTPLDLVVGLEADRLANGPRESHPALLVNDGRTHRGIIPRERRRVKLYVMPVVEMPQFARQNPRHAVGRPERRREDTTPDYGKSFVTEAKTACAV